MMKVGTSDLATWLGRGDAEVGTGSPFERYFLISLLCIGIIILYKRRFDWYKAVKENVWMTVLILYMLLSLFWTDAPLMSLKRCVRELIAVIMVFMVLSEDNPRNAVESVLRRSIYVLIPLSLLLVLFFPEHGIKTFGDMEAWVGVTNHKNGLGRLCYIAAFFLIWALIARKPKLDVPRPRYNTYSDMLVLGMALYLLKGPGIGKLMSIASVITLLVGLTSLFGLFLMRKLNRNFGANVFRIVIAGIIVAGTASVFVGGLVVGGEITSSFGREETLTGRTAIWSSLLPYVEKEPIIGYGMDGFFTETMQRSLGNLPHAHNGYLGIILDYGFVGLVFVSMFLLSSCTKAYKSMGYDYSWGNLWMSFLIMSLIHNVTEPSIDTFTTQQMAIILFLYVSSSVSSQCTNTAKDIPAA